ncbi:MAG: Imm40 family immunity protein [Ferruginibacter sp.]
MEINIEEILKIGKPLYEIGINNWALSKPEALNAIDQFHSLGISILGGDVYTMTNELFIPTHDNWYCDQLPQEAQIEFLNRSIVKARHYIEAYKINADDKIYFVLVPDF